MFKKWQVKYLNDDHMASGWYAWRQQPSSDEITYHRFDTWFEAITYADGKAQDTRLNLSNPEFSVEATTRKLTDRLTEISGKWGYVRVIEVISGAVLVNGSGYIPIPQTALVPVIRALREISQL